jgi:hypothetical protein
VLRVVPFDSVYPDPSIAVRVLQRDRREELE